ncbi:hypothetical protein UFOVP155_6 [uncultured Caudovirales phage]|uniref:Uncharacterized protein n=1 Tax=uncultured Caudovirales phage TaxID=2100421 RepID=A0A6J7W8H1_9CAUD|nr:hypothetical protein UFOVP155_6 [uncultured Caudovirales phage]
MANEIPTGSLENGYITKISIFKSLRDDFAMWSLLGINTKEFNPKEIAEKAYAIADAMMEARK